ncbi:MAG: murein biosynthesis integral membrane protein MurJ [Deltaproteobacteria bacterium]|nr:murein biosynthesis integral membrane protein MurJ [Deltaproteobacteria bacterium]
MSESSTRAASLARHAGTVSGLTLLSRICGLARDMVFASLFGAGFAADAFNIAFTIPNVFRRFVAEGAMSVAFVPVFSDYQSTRSRAETLQLFHVTFSWFSLALGVLVGVAIAASPLLVKLFAPGFEPDKFELAVLLNRMMFPYLFFVGMTSLLVGILNTHGHFAAPAAAPILLNLAIIASALGLHDRIEPAISAMAVGVLAGGMLELALQWPFVRAYGVRLRFRFQRGHPAVRKMLLLMGPAAFGMAVYQVNILVSRALASLLPEGSVTFIYYSDRFMELPLGVFAVAVATVALPSLSRHAARGEMTRFVDTLGFALRLTLLVCVPAMVWLAVCRVPVIATLLQRGRFTHADTLATAQVFLAASAGIWAVAGIRNLVPAFYALKDTKTPVAIAFVAFLVNAALGAVLMWPLGPAGLTLANTLSSMLNFCLLLVYLRRKIGPLEGRRLFGATWRVCLASAVAGAAAWPACGLSLWSSDGQLLEKLALLAATGAAAMVAFVLVAWLLRVEELRQIVGKLLRRA